jgi:hypothetical protein
MLGSLHIDWVAKGLAVLAALGGFLYWILRKAIEERLAKRLEQTKHELQSELQRISIVYEHQKDSFRAILSAMHAAMRKIEDRIEDDGSEWPGISVDDFDRFKRAIEEERLFVDARAERALTLFTSILWDAVASTRFDHFPESDEVRRAFNHLEFVASRMAEYFRLRVGLTPEVPDPLLDTELLGASRIINTYDFAEARLPKEHVLKFGDYTLAEETVSLARQHRTLLETQLRLLKRAVEAKETRSRVYYLLLIKIDRYLKLP